MYALATIAQMLGLQRSSVPAAQSLPDFADTVVNVYTRPREDERASPEWWACDVLELAQPA